MSIQHLSTIIESASELLGAVVTGLVAMVTLMITFRREKQKARDEERARIEAVLGALRAEITALWDIYMSSMGEIVEARDPQTEYFGKWPMGERYFFVYEANAGSLGSIGDEKLRNQIVRSYARTQGLIDSYRCLGDLCDKLEGGYPDPATAEKVLRDYQVKVKEHHFIIKAEYKTLLELFDNHQRNHHVALH